jgi:hypothetical protein
MLNMENVKITKCPVGFAFGYWSECGTIATLSGFSENIEGEYTPAINHRGVHSTSSTSKKFFYKK